MYPGGINRPYGGTGANIFDSNQDRQMTDANEERADLLADGSLSDEASSARKKDKSEDKETREEASIEEHARLAKQQLAQQSGQTAPPDTLMIMEDAAEELSQAASSSRSTQNKSLEQRRSVGVSRQMDLELEGESELQAYMVEAQTDTTGLAARLKKFLGDFEEDPQDALETLKKEKEDNATEIGIFLQLAMRFGEESQSEDERDGEGGDSQEGLSQFKELQKEAATFSFKNSDSLENLKEVYAHWKAENRTTLYAGFNVISDAHQQAVTFLREQGSGEDTIRLRSIISTVQKDYGAVVLEAMQNKQSNFGYHPSSHYLSSMAPEGGTKDVDLNSILKSVRTKFKAFPLATALPQLITMISHDIDATKSSTEEPVLQTLFKHANTLATLGHLSETAADKMEELRAIHPSVMVNSDELTYDIAEISGQSFLMESNIESIMVKHGTDMPKIDYDYDNAPAPTKSFEKQLKTDKEGLEVSMNFLRGVGDLFREIPAEFIKREEKGREELLGLTRALQERANDQESVVYDLLIDTQAALNDGGQTIL